MDGLDLDLRASLRVLRRSPGLAAIAVAALAMGIGFTTTMFSIARGGTRPLPFRDPEQLLALTRTHPRLGLPDLGALPFDYRQWTAQQTSFAGLAAFTTLPFNLSGQGERPERIPGSAVTPNAFPLLGEQPVLGRGFREDDAAPGAPPVIVIGYDLWQRRFSGSRAILDGTLRINGEPHTVVGVMPAGFGFPVNASAWIPLRLPVGPAPGDGDAIAVFGRLLPDATLDRAAAELATIGRGLAGWYPTTHGELSIRAFPFAEMEMPRALAAVLHLMVGATSFVLLIACANVANLLLARAATRTRDAAIRIAIGASRHRIIGQHLAESFVLAAIGAVIGLGIAHVAVRFFDIATANIIEAFWMEFRVDGIVVVFTMMLTVLAAVAAGVTPAIRASDADVVATLKDHGPGASSFRLGKLSSALVVGEVALSCGLLIMTAMLVQTALRLRTVALAFDARSILTAEVGVPPATMKDPEGRNRLYPKLVGALEGVQGARSAALVSTLPGRGAGNWTFAFEDVPADGNEARPATGVVAVTPGFLSVLNSAVVRGRDLSWLDRAGAPGAALANESFVRRFSADDEILGRQVRIGASTYTIVGIVADLQVQDIEDRSADGLYVPLLQSGPRNVRIMIRTAVGDPLSLARAVTAAVSAAEPDLPIYEMLTLRAAIYQDKRVLDALATLFFLFGVGAVFLTVIGLYGVVSFSVTQRMREIGVRRALGAQPLAVLALVLRGGTRWVGLGLGLGLVLAFALSRAFVAGVEAADPAGPLTFALVAGSLAITALLALVMPARRALAVQPHRALRSE